MRIMIVGLTPKQNQVVVNHCRQHKVKFCFYPADQSNVELPQVDFAVLSRFIYHDWVNRLNSILPRNRVKFVSGGLRSIIKEIDDFVVKQNSQNLVGAR